MPSKVEKKIQDLQGQNVLLINKLLKVLSNDVAPALASGGTAPSTNQRGILDEVKRTVVTGYAKPGSRSTTGPFDFFEKIFDRLDPDKKDKSSDIPVTMPPWYKKLIGPALLILGGLAAFVTGIMTDGPLKGFLKLLSQGGIMGGLKWMSNILNSTVTKAIEALSKVFGKEAVAKVIGSGKQLITKIILPFKRFFISTIPKFIGKLVGPVAKVVGSSPGAITKMLAKVGVSIAKNLKFIPVLGGLISFGFAISRYRKGDVIGGTIDLVSGILGMVPIGPWSAVTIPLSIGLSVLNAVLDAKAGGATGKQTMAKGDMLKKWGAKLMGFIYRLPPMSTVYHIAQGITQGLSGNWKAAANHFMYSIPVVGAVLDWFNIGGFKDPKGEPIKGSPTKFWTKIINFITKIPPIQTVFSLGKMLNAVFQGQWSQAARYAMYSIPFVGSVLDWFNVGSSWGQPKGEKVEGDKKGFWSSIWNFVTKLPPISNVIHLAKGISNIFKGNFVTAGKHMMRSIPIIGNLISWFGGDVDAPEDSEQLGSGKGFFASIKDGFLQKFKDVWNKLPKWAKWTARKLPFLGGLLKQLDTEDDAAVNVAMDSKVSAAITDGYSDLKKTSNNIWSSVTGTVRGLGKITSSSWQAIGDTAKGVWNGIKSGISGYGEMAKGAWEGIKGVSSGAWKVLKGDISGFKDMASGAWEGIKGVASGAWNAIASGPRIVGSVAKSAWEGIKGVASGAWDIIKSGASTLGSMAGSAWDGIKGVASGAWNVIKSGASALGSVASGAWDGIKSTASACWDIIKSGASTLGSVASGAWDGIKNIANSAWDTVKSGVSSVGNVASRAWSGIKGTASSVWSGISSNLSKLGSAAGSALKGVSDAANTVWSGFKAGFRRIGSAAAAAANGLASAASDAWKGAKKGLSDVWKGAKNIASGITKRITGSSTVSQTSDVIKYNRNTWLRLQKIHTTLLSTLSTIKRLDPDTAANRFRNKGLSSALLAPTNVISPKPQVDPNDFSNQPTAFAPDTKAVEAAKQLESKKNSDSLSTSVELQKEMIQELKTGAIYQSILSMTEKLGGKLDAVVANSNQPTLLPIPGQTNRGGDAAQQSPGRLDRMNNRTA